MIYTEQDQLLARIADLEDQLARCIEPLSPAEIRVLRLVASGMDNARIGKQLNMGTRSVRNHVNHILKKTGATNRVQAARYAWRNGYVDPDEAWATVVAQEWGLE